MVLNIFPRREKAAAAPAIEPEPVLPEPSPEALEDAKKRTRRGTRGGRGRRKPLETETAEAEAEAGTEAATEPEAIATVLEKPAPRRAPRRTAAAAAAAEPAPEAPPEEPKPEEPPARPLRARKPRTESETAAPAPAKAAPAAAGDLKALARAIEAQGKQLEHLVRVQEDLARRMPTGGGGLAGAVPARIGVFVDSANIELACDRLRSRIDWKKLLDFITEGRQLVRAIAYSPVHDDPGVSLETQRFAEPFIGKGFRVVTKPLKRFADGSIKANVDIEMALDIMEMLDRLDVVCLVSGDGDFQRLVEVVQMKGVRVEVVGVGTSTATQLRNAGDRYVDIQNILSKVKA
ncbi:MAG: NYN domain-containing protein [Dehalococcoidia bacterium]|nr:NYN domain-containing protein [Dehalococcoidia bacterium]